MRLVLTALCVSACAHGVTNEERLDLSGSATESHASDARCRDTTPEIQLARDAAQKRAERLDRYASAITETRGTLGELEAEAKRDPDLVYGPTGDEWSRRSNFCKQLLAALEREQVLMQHDVEPVAAVAVVEKAEKVEAEPEPLKKTSRRAKAKAAAAAAPEESSETASAADEAFGDDADALRKTYKTSAKKSKWSKAKAKKSKKPVRIAGR